MDKVVRYLGMILLLTIVSSCIREDYSGCLSQYTVRVYVKDKNYVNVDAVSPQDKVDESLSFRKFVGTVYYTLFNISTGILVHESFVTAVVDNGDYFTFTLSDVPYGNYKLTVWGNSTTNVVAGNLHQDHKEQTDIYLVSSELKVEEAYLTSDITLQRTKGLLLVRIANYPGYIKGISTNVTGLYESVNPYFSYIGNTSVLKEFPLQKQMQVLLAPSVGKGASILQLKLYTIVQPRVAPAITLPDIPIDVYRNEISLVSLDYNVNTGMWEIWTYINREWTQIHNLDAR